MNDDELTGSKFLFLGNQLWLDFLNTKIKQGGDWVDLLGSFADFVDWLGEAEVLDRPHAQEALRRWSKPTEQAAILEEVRAFRAVLYAAVESITQGKTVPREAVEAINRVLRHHRRSFQLVWDGAELVSRYEGEITEPVHLLATMAESAAQALTGGDVTLTRKAENPACVLHFHDTPHNHTRRWGRLETCGNRRKAAAHYQRSHSRSISKE